MPNKVALILGGTGGIGCAACELLARDGYDVAVHYFSNEKKANEIVSRIRSLGRKSEAFKADLFSDQGSDIISETEKQFGGLTTLVHAAAEKITNTPFVKMPWEEMDRQWRINVKVTFDLCRRAIPFFERQGRGKIILVTTLYTEIVPPPELAGYVTAKYAMNGLAKAMAVELATKNITVNLVSPGMTETEMVAGVPKDVKTSIAGRVPMKRLAKPEDVAAAIAYLASDRADYVTGETIRVNGGQAMV